MTVRCGVSPRRICGYRSQHLQRRGLIRPIGNPGGLRSDPDLLSSGAAQQHPSRRCIDLDDVDRADRAGVVGIDRGDARGLQEMEKKLARLISASQPKKFTKPCRYATSSVTPGIVSPPGQCGIAR
jgi:hypothetical protein